MSLGSFREVAPKFPFVCFVTNAEWLRKGDVGRRFVKAWLAAGAWVDGPANRAGAGKLLAGAAKGAPAPAGQNHGHPHVNNPAPLP
ncbi:hypothetical protein B4Q13_19410, partial [Lacticaseibacillus rhamnosus]